jgi:hypothetical protein
MCRTVHLQLITSNNVSDSKIKQKSSIENQKYLTK